MGWWWDKSSSGRQAGIRRAAFAPTIPSEPATSGYASSGRSRFEVCPPALLDDDFEPTRSGVRSLLPPLTTIRQWFQTGWYSTDQPTHTPRMSTSARATADSLLQGARRAFVQALADVDTPVATDLANRARAAHTLRELWHLRNALFTAVSIGHCETIARDRLATLNQHFPIREQGTLRRPAVCRPAGNTARQPRV